MESVKSCIMSALSFTRCISVLPSKQTVPPNTKSWNETQAVMPPAKTKKRKPGDQAYGAGESSGKKATAKHAKRQSSTRQKAGNTA
jgi:hypothetical protein